MRLAIRFGTMGALSLLCACAGRAEQASTNNSGGTSSTCAAGKERCDCYGNGTCDLGLECRSNLCVAGATGGSTSIGGATSAGGTIGTGGAAPTGGAGYVVTGGTKSTSGTVASGGTGNVIATGGAKSTSVGGVGNTGGSSSSPNSDDRNTITLTNDEWAQLTSASCSGWVAEGALPAANIVFIVDTSGSMNDVSQNTSNGRSKWAITKTALASAFDTMPRLTSVGMLLWPNMMTIPNNNTNCAYCNPDGSPNANGVGECVNVSAMVPLDKMGAVGSSHRVALAGALEAVTPQGGTPMADAYNYALDSNYGNNPLLSGKKYAVLITDGQPTIQLGCMGTGEEKRPVDFTPVASSIAGAFQYSPYVRTFVIGSPGSEHQTLTGADGRSELSQAAVDGDTKVTPGCSNTGTPNYCHYDMSAAADFATGLSAALDNIAGQVLSCTYTVNDAQLQGQIFNPDKINVIYQINGSTALGDIKLIAKATSPDCPESNGWYLDPNDPNGKTIMLCPMTCDRIHQDAGAIIDIRGGCDTVVVIN
jgi:hypothetical protein